MPRRVGSDAGGERAPSRWSAVLPHAHLKLGGMVGALVNLPLAPLLSVGGRQSIAGGGPAGQVDVSGPGRGAAGGSGAQASGLSGVQVPQGQPAVAPIERVVSGVPRFLCGSVEWLKQGTASGRLLASVPRSPSEATMLGHCSSTAASGPLVVKPFASGGALLQLGSFQRGFLDFTRIMAKVISYESPCGAALPNV